MKTCARCGLVKPDEDFYRDPRYADGRKRGACKNCLSAARPRRVVVPTTKQCSKCGQVKPSHEFLGESRHADGLRSECRDCFNTKTRYLKMLDWKRQNPERVRTYNVRQRKARLRYQRKHPEAGQAIRGRRRAQRRGNGPNDLTATQWKAIKAAYGNRCAYCGIQLARLTMDHVVALVNGGAHTAANIVPACKPCNSRKQDNAAPTHQPHLLI